VLRKRPTGTFCPTGLVAWLQCLGTRPNLPLCTLRNSKDDLETLQRPQPHTQRRGIRELRSSAACSSTIATPGAVPTSTPGVGFSPEILTIHFTNKLDRSVWLTPYWSTKVTPGWHIEGPACVPAGQTIPRHIAWSTVLGGPEAYLRIEVKVHADCGGDTVGDGDQTGPVCHVQFNGDSSDADSNASAYYDNGYRVSDWSGGDPGKEACI
jgi:hypothetical protein